MKVIVGLVFVILAASGLSLAASGNAPDRPPGIAADSWAAISSTVGVVLVADMKQRALPPLMMGTFGSRADETGPGPAPRVTEMVGGVDLTGLFAAPSAAVQAIIDEGVPVRGYIMVKRGKVWRPLAVVAPSVDN